MVILNGQVGACDGDICDCGDDCHDVGGDDNGDD
jgi:hypothetical protein